VAPPRLLTRPAPPIAGAPDARASRASPQPPPEPTVPHGARRAASPAGLPPAAPGAGGHAGAASGVAAFAPRLGDVTLLFSPHKRAELRQAKQKRAEHADPQQLREQAAAQQAGLPAVRAAEAAMAGKLGLAVEDGVDEARAAPKNMKKASATTGDVKFAALAAGRLFRGDTARAAAAASALIEFDPGAAGTAAAGAHADALKLLRALAGNPDPIGAQAAARLIDAGGYPSPQTLACFAAAADAVDPKRKARDVGDLARAVDRAKTHAAELPGAAQALHAAKFDLSSGLTDDDTFVPARHAPWSAQGSRSTQESPVVEGTQAERVPSPQHDVSPAVAAAQPGSAPHPYVTLSVAAMAIDLRGPDPGTVFGPSDIDAALKSLRQDGVDKRFQVGARSA
jgi:hypothetical protein